MSVGVMSKIFEYNMPNLKTDDGKNVPDSTAKFVLLALADHAGEDGENAYIGVRRICRKTSMSTSTVCNALNALRNNGYIELIGKSKKDTNNYTINISRFQPPKHPDSSHRNPSVLATETNPSLTINKPSMPVDWKIAHGETVTEEDVKKGVMESNATNAFERIFGFGTLPWDSNTTWTKFKKFIVRIYAADPGMFADYIAWRNGEGKYKAFSNRKIRENPAAFMDTGYPEYEASKMYRKTDETRPEYRLHVPDDKAQYVPRPAHLKPNIKR